jgi:hypothetical protein
LSDAPLLEGSGIGSLALEKLTRVLGSARGQSVYAEVLVATGRPQIHSADDLHAFAEALSRRGGIEGAVGALLSVAAVLRGAEPRAVGE